MLTTELIAHMDAGNRRLWTADQDTRPLCELGRQQALRITEALALAPITALYSSPALRCRQTLEPLSTRFQLPITVLPDLRETYGFQLPEGWVDPPDWAPDPLGVAYAAGRAWAAFRQIIATAHGRVAVCSHGDIVPAFAAFITGAFGLALPTPHYRRGGWYTLEFDGDLVSARLNDILPDFPS